MADFKKDFKGKKITVMGLGLQGGGVAVAKFLARHKAKVLVTDIKSKKELAPSLASLKGLKIEYVLGIHREEDFIRSDMIIKNPAVPWESPYLALAKKHHVPIETDAGIFFKYCPSPVMGVTGTKGKTTVATLAYEMIREEKKNALLGGNIPQMSLLDLLEKIKKNTPVILELSSWQLEGLKKPKISPHIACITNIYPDHLNRYRSLEEYIASKKIIFLYQGVDDFLVLNFDQEEGRNFAREAKGRIFWFSLRQKAIPGAYVQDGKIYFACDKEGKTEEILSTSSLKLRGEHNLANVLAAVVLAGIYGIKAKSIQKVLRDFKGVPHRLEEIRNWNGIKFYNDTTATNPHAAIVALSVFPEPIILLAGGASKKLPSGELAKKIQEKAKAVILFKGEASDDLKKELKKIRADHLIKKEVAGMFEAIEEAKKWARRGDVVLLSPGAASFGLFKNEFDRGKQFRQIVLNLT